MKKTSYIPLVERRYLLVTVVGAIIATQIADIFAKDYFKDFYSYNLLTKVVGLILYPLFIFLFTAIILFFAFKLFKF